MEKSHCQQRAPSDLIPLFSARRRWQWHSIRRERSPHRSALPADNYHQSEAEPLREMHTIYAGVRLAGLQAMWKLRRQVIQFFKPPASRKNKHADTSLNMPGGLLSHPAVIRGVGGRYIIQGSVFASPPPHTTHPPRLSDPSDKTSDKSEGLRVHALRLNVHGGGEKVSFFLYTVRLAETDARCSPADPPAYVTVCSDRPIMRRHTRAPLSQDSLFKISSRFALRNLPPVSLFIIENKWRPVSPSCYLKDENNETKERERERGKRWKNSQTFTGNRGNRSLLWNSNSAFFLSKFQINHAFHNFIHLPDVIKIHQEVDVLIVKAVRI